MSVAPVASPPRVAREKIRIGDPVLSSTANEMARVMRHLVCHRQDSVSLCYAGVPDEDIGVGASATSHFHLITHRPDRTDVATEDERQYGLQLAHWLVPERAMVTRSITSTPDQANSPGSADTLYSADYLCNLAAAQTYGDYGCSTQVQLAHDGFLIDPQNGAWVHSLIKTQRILAAQLAVYELPFDELAAEQADVTGADVAVGQTIRGQRDSGPRDHSIGTVAHRVGADESCEWLTRRAMIAWSHPVGVYTGATGGIGYEDVFPSTFLATPRNLVGSTSGTIKALTAICVSASDSGDKIRLSSSTGGGTWTYTTDGTESETMVTPAGGSPAGGLSIDSDDTDEITVQWDVAIGHEVTLHAVFLIEGSAGIGS